MSNENDDALTNAFNADAYWGKTTANVEQQLADLLEEARKYSVDSLRPVHLRSVI